jgi:UDP-N-acetylmuramoylalanine--D-glutamate ligase
MIDPRSLFGGKKITVMGLGLLGRGLGDTIFLIRCGARVTVTDLKSAEELKSSVERLQGLDCTLKLGGHDPDDFIHADMILRNADVPRSSPFLKIAAERGVPVEMDESLFCKHFKGNVVGVTGTRGKTTTTILVHKVLSASRSPVFLSGNLLGCATLPLLAEARDGDTVVLELSSWQLQGFHDAGLSPSMSIFTNVYPDHLNRYNGMEDYIADKKAIFLYQRGTDFCVFNGIQPETGKMADEAPAGRELFSPDDIPAEWRVRLPGKHNLENIAAATRLCRKLGVPEELIRASVEEFQGVDHRLQWLGEKNGLAFVNDSTSTTPVAGCAALESFDRRRILLIAGGSDKKLDMRPFAEAAGSRCARIALLEGTATPALLRDIISAGHGDKIAGVFGNLRAAVETLSREAQYGDLLLFSPGCASFGMFRNEYHRGETFMAIAHEYLRK